MTTARRPMLVTGSHRSGTTWVGQLLSQAGNVAHIHEPLNPNYRLSWLGPPPAQWFEYIDNGNAGRYLPAFERLLSMRPPLGAHLRTVRSPRNLAANGRELLQVMRWRAAHARPLVKDPIAFFSAPWLASTFEMQVVVMVRHPAAFAGSLKKQHWAFDFTNFTTQPRLMHDYLGPWADDIEAYAARPPDIVDQAILLWRCINSVALRYRAEHPEWLVLRYEDLAADPLAGTRALYEFVGLPWSDACERRVRSLSSKENPAEVSVNRTRDVRRNSEAAMWTWQHRLSPDELDRVRVGTADVAQFLYTDADWDHSPV